MSNTMAIVGRLRAVLAGKSRPYTRAGSVSAIDKQPLDHAVTIGTLGIEGDEQGDTRVHGGVDKAVHCYGWSHYEHWRCELSGEIAAALLRRSGAFGENFSLEPGLDETNVCIGDRWAIGGARDGDSDDGAALFEVSQGRQPCWKLNDRFGVSDMARRVQQSGRAGWYLRVLRPGRIRAGDTIRLVARPHPDWPLARLLRAIAERNCDPGTLTQIVALPLPPSWARLFRGRLETGQVEPWTARLEGRQG